MTEIALFITDKAYPQLTQWLVEAEASRAIIGPNEFSVFQTIRERFSKEELQSAALLLYGASLQRCVGAMAEELLVRQGATNVTVDLKKSCSLEESKPHIIHTLDQRRNSLLANRPVLGEYIENGVLRILVG